MTSKQILLDTLNGKKDSRQASGLALIVNDAGASLGAERMPFIPAIYEHKAALINKTPSEVCCNADLLYEALVAEYETYKPDLLTVGIDVYNIEPEALGSVIRYGNGNEAPTIEKPVLDFKDIDDLKIPNPETDGRMPVIIEATEKIISKLGNDVLIAVGVSAPFSLTAGLMGQENLLIKSIEEPEYITKVISFCTEVQKTYISAILKTGAEIVLFDSSAAPPMISPAMYEEFIFPSVKETFDLLKSRNAKFLSYIVGGNTIPILQYILRTGANNILCDFNADTDHYLNAVKGTGISLRKNISPTAILYGSSEDLTRQVMEIIEKGREYPGFILGTAILPYDTPLERVKLIKSILDKNI
jgi:uroporphyrinogen decarboxylase